MVDGYRIRRKRQQWRRQKLDPIIHLFLCVGWQRQLLVCGHTAHSGCSRSRASSSHCSPRRNAESANCLNENDCIKWIQYNNDNSIGIQCIRSNVACGCMCSAALRFQTKTQNKIKLKQEEKKTPFMPHTRIFKDYWNEFEYIQRFRTIARL